MANVVNQNPLVLDTDFTDLTAVTNYLAGTLPVRVRRVVLESNGTTVAGTVNIQDTARASNDLEPLVVAAAAGSAGTKLYDIVFVVPEVWQNFKVTGLTATVTKLYLFLE